MAAESPVTQSLGRVLPRDQGASGACGSGPCQESREAGRSVGRLRWCQGGEETDKSLKNLGGKGEGRGRAAAGSRHGQKRVFQMGEM